MSGSDKKPLVSAGRPAERRAAIKVVEPERAARSELVVLMSNPRVNAYLSQLATEIEPEVLTVGIKPIGRDVEVTLAGPSSVIEALAQKLEV